jgi:hypothetical protein
MLKKIDERLIECFWLIFLFNSPPLILVGIVGFRTASSIRYENKPERLQSIIYLFSSPIRSQSDRMGEVGRRSGISFSWNGISRHKLTWFILKVRPWIGSEGNGFNHYDRFTAKTGRQDARLTG